MTDFKFKDEEVTQLMKLLSAAEERIACHRKIIIHEEETIKQLRPILRKYCNHVWVNDSLEPSKKRCQKCLLLQNADFI